MSRLRPTAVLTNEDKRDMWMVSNRPTKGMTPRSQTSDVPSAEAMEANLADWQSPQALGLALAIPLILGCGWWWASNHVALLDALPVMDVKDIFRYVQETVVSLGPLGYVFFSAVYILAEILAVPALPLTGAAGYLFGVVPGTLVVLFSASIAASVSFMVGRTLLRSTVEK